MKAKEQRSSRRSPALSKARQRIGGDLFLNPDAATFTGKVDKTVGRRLAALPFVRSRKGEARCFWSVEATGKYDIDCATGRKWARQVLPLLRYNVGGPLLGWIVVDMIRAGRRNGLVLGFVREITDELKAARGNLLFAAIAADRRAPRFIRKMWRTGSPKIAKRLADAL